MIPTLVIPYLCLSRYLPYVSWWDFSRGHEVLRKPFGFFVTTVRGPQWKICFAKMVSKKCLMSSPWVVGKTWFGICCHQLVAWIFAWKWDLASWIFYGPLHKNQPAASHLTLICEWKLAKEAIFGQDGEGIEPLNYHDSSVVLLT
jgi:hypothetical protein